MVKEVCNEVSLLGLLPTPTLALIFADAKRLSEQPAEQLRAMVEAIIVARPESEQYRFCAEVNKLNRFF